MSVFTPESGCSAERESVGINSRIQEFNCERAVTYRIVLSAYLFKVQPGNAQLADVRFTPKSGHALG
jgi:hypothetical protein